MPYACPDCGAPVSERAAVCPQCGFPIRRDAIPARLGGAPGAPSSGNRAAVLVVALVVGGFFVMMVIGVLAALAIPRFTQAARRAKEMEGEMLLKRAYLLEESYREENGRYTAIVANLRTTGDLDAPARFYDLQVSAADDRALCLEAVPRPAAVGQVRALSMDADGRLYHDAGCTGDSELSGTHETSTAPGPGGEPGARAMLREVYDGVAAYRAEHGQDPASYADALDHVHDSRAAAEYALGSTGSGSRLCIIATPRDDGSPLKTFSVDLEGRLFEGDTCSGTLVEQFSSGEDASLGSSDLDAKPRR